MTSPPQESAETDVLPGAVAPAGAAVGSRSVGILAYSSVAHALTHVYTILHTPLLMLMAADLGGSAATVAASFTAMNLFFGVGAIPAGWLSDKLGEKTLLLAFFVGCAIGGLVIGAAGNIWVLTAGGVLLGLATSIYHPVGTALVSKGVERKGLAMGIVGVAGSVGTALGPLLAAAVSSQVSWRWAYIGLAMPTLLIGACFVLFDLGEAGRPQRARRRSRENSSDDATRGRRGAPKVLVAFGLLLAAMTFGGFYFHLSTTALPPHLADNVGSTASGELAETVARRGGYLSALAMTFGIVGQLVAGVLCDRMDKRRLYVLNYCIIVPVVFLIGLLSGLPLVIVACLSTVFFFAVQPIENTLIADMTPTAWRGAVYGLKFVLVFAVGGTGTWIATELGERASTATVFFLATGVSLAALACAVAALWVRFEHTVERR